MQAQVTHDAPGAGKSMAAVLQPFVDSHTLAGAVTLVATADKVLRGDSSVANDFRWCCPSPPRAAHCRPGPGSPAAAAFDLGLGDRRFSAASAARPTCSRARVPTGSAARRGLPWALECNAFGVLRGSA